MARQEQRRQRRHQDQALLHAAEVPPAAAHRVDGGLPASLIGGHLRRQGTARRFERMHRIAVGGGGSGGRGRRRVVGGRVARKGRPPRLIAQPCSLDCQAHAAAARTPNSAALKLPLGVCCAPWAGAAPAAPCGICSGLCCAGDRLQAGDERTQSQVQACWGCCCGRSEASIENKGDCRNGGAGGRMLQALARLRGKTGFPCTGRCWPPPRRSPRCN